MDIREIDKFFVYNPVFDLDPQYMVDNIISQAKKYISEEKLPLIQKAYDFARNAHGDDKRLSGEPYIIHPLKAAEFLMELKPDLQSIQACILHDVIEDTSISYDDIAKEFGEGVANLCEGLVKVSKVRYRGEDRQLETLKKTFLAMGKDLRVIFIKLADRIHNIQTLHYHPNSEKRKKIAQETMKIYVPITKRLGLYYYQLYLENGSFKILNEKEFYDILSYLKKYFERGEKYTDKGIGKLKEILKKEGIKDFKVKGRIKSPYRVFEKAEKKYETAEYSSIMDVLAYRVIVKDVSQCYMVLGAIHKHYTPLIKKIKDYIAVPKFNGYRSIHTTVLGMFPFPTEIQIRTDEMDDVAEFGVAAHFGYSENMGPTAISKQQSEWIKKLQDLVNMYRSTDQKEEFKQELNIEVMNKGTFLYTPEGDIIELPRNSTVLDFAFHVHTEIGLSFKNALVNWEIKPITYIPKTGDVVHINTFKNKYSASKHWLDFLNTPSAKSKLNRFLKQNQKQELLNRSVRGLNETLKEFNLPLYKSDTDKLSKTIEPKELERSLLDVLDKKGNYSQIIKMAYPKERLEHQNERQGTVSKPVVKKPIQSQIVIDGDKALEYYLCPECKPDSGDKVIAKSGKDGIKIHTLECKALKTANFDKLLEAHWQGEERQKYRVKLELKMLHKYGNIVNIMTIFSDLMIPIIQISIQNTNDNMSLVSLDTEFENPAKIAYMFKDLKKYKDLIKIVRRKII